MASMGGNASGLAASCAVARAGTLAYAADAASRRRCPSLSRDARPSLRHRHAARAAARGDRRRDRRACSTAAGSSSARRSRAFEQEFAAYCGVRHAIGVANGTDALTIALRALGVGPGDEVVVPSFTFYASAEAIPPTGARPVFCDVDPETFCVTPETVQAALTPRTKA